MHDYKHEMQKYDEMRRLKFALAELLVTMVVGSLVMMAIYWRVLVPFFHKFK
jgi:Tfp pilus assembly protein PilW